ncbi:hypothetical protein INT45_003576 [Circinella minor]|uniref:Uncharacterized protein n=1 Tax=Circinella minor TaxID=1195481 RepID=A0A8H7S508_9FUNG|nr:hypothetical protein INT45_003576 [Circinella minor]
MTTKTDKKRKSSGSSVQKDFNSFSCGWCNSKIIGLVHFKSILELAKKSKKQRLYKSRFERAAMPSQSTAGGPPLQQHVSLQQPQQHKNLQQSQQQETQQQLQQSIVQQEQQQVAQQQTWENEPGNNLSQPKRYLFNRPDRSRTKIAILSLKLKRIVDRHGVKQAAYKEFIDYTNEIIFIYSPYRSAKVATNDIYSVNQEWYDVCVNGCRLFYDQSTRSRHGDYRSDICQTCNTSRSEDSTSGTFSSTTSSNNCKPKAQIAMLPLSQQIAYMLYDEDTRKKLLYRHEYIHRPGIYNDIFDGNIYQDMKKNDNLFENKYDIAVYLAADGFAPFKNPSTRRSMTLIQFIVLNFDPLTRQVYAMKFQLV